MADTAESIQSEIDRLNAEVREAKQAIRMKEAEVREAKQALEASVADQAANLLRQQLPSMQQQLAAMQQQLAADKQQLAALRGQQLAMMRGEWHGAAKRRPTRVLEAWEMQAKKLT